MRIGPRCPPASSSHSTASRRIRASFAAVMASSGTPKPGPATGLDLAEDQDRAVAGDDVDLPVTGTASSGRPRASRARVRYSAAASSPSRPSSCRSPIAVHPRGQPCGRAAAMRKGSARSCGQLPRPSAGVLGARAGSTTDGAGTWARAGAARRCGPGRCTPCSGPTRTPDAARPARP